MDGAMCTRWWRVALIAGLLGLIEPSSSRSDIPDPNLWPCASKNPSWVKDEMAALLAIKAELKDPENVLHNWFIHADNPCPCHWKGVACTDDAHVSNLGLSNKRLSGTLSPRIGDLTSLQDLELQDNTISGPIPDSIGRLGMLEILDMSSNKLNGTIPSSLGNLKNLTILELQNNTISGHIPHSIGRLVMLGILDMSNNRLTGTIPSSLGHLKNLEDLGLQNNSISGHIPHSIGKLGMLGTLDMSNNRLNGSIPSSFGHLKNLVCLYLNNNSLSGVVPDSLGAIYSSLDFLDLSFNNLSGPVPSISIRTIPTHFNLCCSDRVTGITVCGLDPYSVEKYCSRGQKGETVVNYSGSTETAPSYGETPASCYNIYNSRWFSSFGRCGRNASLVAIYTNSKDSSCCYLKWFGLLIVYGAPKAMTSQLSVCNKTTSFITSMLFLSWGSVLDG